MGNVLNTLSSATKEDAKLYNCIKELYDQGVPFEELKALIPDMKRTREQLRIKRMLENNNEMLVSMITKEMSFASRYINIDHHFLTRYSTQTGP